MSKRLITMVTLMWFFASVGQHMRCQAAFLVEGFIAHVALKWRLSGVNPYVPRQITRPSETYMADFTLVCFFTRMDKRVSLESGCSGERQTADVAGVHRCCGSVDALTRWRLQILCCSIS